MNVFALNETCKSKRIDIIANFKVSLLQGGVFFFHVVLPCREVSPNALVQTFAQSARSSEFGFRKFGFIFHFAVYVILEDLVSIVVAELKKEHNHVDDEEARCKSTNL